MAFYLLMLHSYFNHHVTTVLSSCCTIVLLLLGFCCTSLFPNSSYFISDCGRVKVYVRIRPFSKEEVVKKTQSSLNISEETSQVFLHIFLFFYQKLVKTFAASNDLLFWF